MRKLMLALMPTVALTFPLSAAAADGLVKVKSEHPVAATADKLANAITGKGLNIFARVNHTEGAEEAGMELRPTELIIFGNPKAGTPLMQCAQSVGIDLPQKALIWEDEDGEVWLGYNDPEYLKERHGMEDCDEPLENVGKVLENFAEVATQ
ncbi:DUF302 domain-containing protein [Marinobacter sp.]